MATPSYTTIISAIVTRLQQDNRLSAINDNNVYFGAQPNIPAFPAVSVELQEADDVWISYPNNKDIVSKITVSVLDRSMAGYEAGLQAIEGYVKTIDDVFHTDRTISGVCYNSEVITRRFGTGVINETPVFICEMDLRTVSRYNSRN